MLLTAILWRMSTGTGRHCKERVTSWHQYYCDWSHSDCRYWYYWCRDYRCCSKWWNDSCDSGTVEFDNEHTRWSEHHHHCHHCWCLRRRSSTARGGCRCGFTDNQVSTFTFTFLRDGWCWHHIWHHQARRPHFGSNAHTRLSYSFIAFII